MTALGKTSLALVGLLAFLLASAPAGAATDPGTTVLRDGQHDFDFGIGSFKTHIRRLQHPLSGSTSWVDYQGSVVTSPVWGGKAQLEELGAGNKDGHFEGITLRLYDTQSHLWELYWSNSADGTVGPAMVGAFQDGVGTFYDQEDYDGRALLVRNIYSGISAGAYHFEQAFSDDGGGSWETNFIADLTRESNAPGEWQAGSAPINHDFDWQLGSWTIHMDRMLEPLTGSHDWTPYDGTVVVRKVWGGRANLAEIKTAGPSGQLEFLSLRLYDPKARQWTLRFAHSGSGELGSPMSGEFKGGRGAFYDQSELNGHATLERFVFDDITAGAGRDEQAFSPDGGKTWEVNWINHSTRAPAP